MSESYWRRVAREAIYKAQKEAEAGGMDAKQRKRHISQAYPFYGRENWPYKVWLSEVAYMEKKPGSPGFRRNVTDLPGQTRMFGDSADGAPV